MPQSTAFVTFTCWHSHVAGSGVLSNGSQETIHALMMQHWEQFWGSSHVNRLEQPQCPSINTVLVSECVCVCVHVCPWNKSQPIQSMIKLKSCTFFGGTLNNKWSLPLCELCMTSQIVVVWVSMLTPKHRQHCVNSSRRTSVSLGNNWN